MERIAIGSGPFEPLPPPSARTARSGEVLQAVAAAIELLRATSLPLRVARRGEVWSVALGQATLELQPDDDEVAAVAAVCGTDPQAIAAIGSPEVFPTDLVGVAADACRQLGGGWYALGDELGVTDPTLAIDTDGEVVVTLSALARPGDGHHTVEVRFTVPPPDQGVLVGLAHDLRDPCIDATREGRSLSLRWW